jgi:hypothetical protein
MTSITAGVDGLTHVPPTKNRSGELRDTVADSVRLMAFLLEVVDAVVAIIAR